jgi:SHS2 domain-containing protein
MSALALQVSPTGLRYAHVVKEGAVTVLGYGATMTQAFEAAAAAMFDLAADLEYVSPVRTVPVSFVETDAAAALVRWLSLLLAAARHNGVSFSEFHLQRERSWWKGCATGGARPARPGHELEVMRVDRARAMVRETPEGWEARCRLDCRPRAQSLQITPGREAPGGGRSGSAIES